MRAQASECSGEIRARAPAKYLPAVKVLAGAVGAATALAIAFQDPLTVDRVRIAVLCCILLVGGVLVHSRRDAAQWRRRLAQSLQTTIDTIPQMVWTWDGSGPVEYNRQWEEFTGVPFRAQAEFDILRLIHEDDQPLVEIEWTNFLAEGEPFDLEYRLKHQSGGFRWVMARAIPKHDGEGKIVGWFGTCTDVHDRVSAQRALVESVTRLKWSSEHDSLTSLLNRRALQAQLDSACLRLPRGKHVGLLLLDLDHFKHVNDSWGHAAGDELVRSVAERLRSTIRGSDLVARLGGDEFAIVITDLGSPADLLSAAEAILSRMKSPVVLAGRSASVGTSIGGALYPGDAKSTDELFKCADAALYTSKQNGRGGVVLYETEMLKEAERSAAQLQVAREIVDRELIVPVYQPKIELSCGACAGFEALLRWKHPEGLQPPNTVDEAFRDYELAAEMAEIIQRSVASDVRSWLDHGHDLGRVSINASPSEFLRDDYAERLLKVLAENNVPPHCIEVEITEQALFNRSAHYVDRALRVLKNAEIAISLDDFGTGYSSLAHLRDFPVDVVKIDQSFTQQICETPQIGEIVAAVINLARGLRIDVVAEGVETQEQADLLRVMGCRFGQGHLFGHATEAGAVPNYLTGDRIAA